ncbi:MAG: S9 family peptidase [Candidatus Eisenbacteria bacterium]|uniref:S9 family peptidase n=1 Tax=Eiseniibacteriota bacterium TaxID=2212470 RepID=A0A948RUA4_UNCEI|nr:S9 family peptidase [Candidatus Eisenbacteria bacterium]MBU1949892.1 S9 family peptidase [Candidatus Eisenbacteria bacterium]MBU2690666.1 S9 family peptidase [Candidatus Eisenbacteria bacterium]
MPQPRQRLIQAEDLFRIALPGSPSLSPDGSQIAFAVKKTDAKKNRYLSHIYSISTKGGRPRQMTTGEQIDGSPAWSPNGRWIAFISNREDKSQIWLLPADGGEARPLTNLAGGPVRDLAWSPDSRKILFGHRIQPKEDPEKKKLKATYKHITRLTHKLDGDGYWPAERWHLWTIGVAGGKARQITFGEDDDSSASWSPDSRRIAFISNRLEDADWHYENSDLYLANADGKRLRKLTTRFGSCEIPTWSNDGKTIYYLGNYAKDGEWNAHPMQVFQISASGGREKNLTPKLDYWTLNMMVTDTASASAGAILLPYTDDGEERLLIYSSERGGTRLYSLSTKTGKLRREFVEDANVIGVSVHRDGNQAAVAMARMMDAGDIYTLPLNGSGAARRLTHVNKAVFNSCRLTEPEEILFHNGQTKIQGWVLKPPGFKPERKYPMLLEVHGGPMCQYGYTFFHEMHLLAAKGYVVTFCNPRGSDGYGTKFRSCIDGKWGTVDYDDCMAVVNSMTRKRYVDSKRLGILGGSYGGFMTTWVVGHTNKFKAAVTQRSAGNMYTMYCSSDFGYSRKYKYKAYPWENPMRYLKDSPNFYAGKMKTPLLIIHSENDLRCPLINAQELFTSLKLQKKTVELVQFEGEFHGLSRGGKPMNRLERLNRIVAWFQRYL